MAQSIMPKLAENVKSFVEGFSSVAGFRVDIFVAKAERMWNATTQDAR